jgi:hypothetical protein
MRSNKNYTPYGKGKKEGKEKKKKENKRKAK